MRVKLLLFGIGVVVFGLQGCTGDATIVPEQPLLVRKEVSELSNTEVAQFTQTLLAMKTVPSVYNPSLSAYDWFVDTHMNAFGPDGSMHGAHMNPDFLPWHREFLRRFESELRRVSGNPHMTVPYWDWTRPASTARLLQDDFMGGDGDPDDNNWVQTGPFREGQWPITITDGDEGNHGDDPDPVPPSWLVRNIAGDDVGTLPVAADVERVLAIPTYDSAPFSMESDPTTSFRNALEGWRPQRALHNQVHVYIAGNMASAASPNDPLFFVHHANVDRIWAHWQQLHGNSTYPESFRNGNMLFWNIPPTTMFDLRAQGIRYSSMAP
jgi:tyrosinase